MTNPRSPEQLYCPQSLDPLTKVGNRGMLNSIAFEWCFWRPFSAIAVGLSGLREINDAVGHAHGDEVLCEVARRIGRTIPPVPDSYLARVGGASFMALVALADAAEVNALAARIVAAIGAPYEVGGRQFTLRARTVIVPSQRQLGVGRFVIQRHQHDVVGAALKALDRASRA